MTQPLPAPPPDEPAAGRGISPPRKRVWRGVTGTLAAGLVVLAVIVLAVQVFALANDAPGADFLFIGAHLVAAAAALVAQRVADRSQGAVAGVAGAVVVLLTGALLWFFWFA